LFRNDEDGNVEHESEEGESCGEGCETSRESRSSESSHVSEEPKDDADDSEGGGDRVKDHEIGNLNESESGSAV